MSPSSGTSYHHGNLRAALVETGFTMARESGPDGVALREVARRVGVSHNAAYRHFADREQLLGEIAEQAMDALTRAMQTRVDAVPHDQGTVARARARLRETGRAYVEFALAEPGLFAVAFASKADAGGADGLGPPTDQGPYGLLNDVLDELVDVGYVHPDERPGSEVVCWAAVHGFAELCLNGPLGAAPAAARDGALDRLLVTIDRGLGT
ncbi:TetR/AcrR family transcriptional regulator [Nocardioides sp. GXQ0305]|uniref:TetR/AcrR family transcriptional regulator n=1 Tax=Nocardioides sp. GXQ0305 TaxID=3423912 RepID=UPI003D7E16F2